MVLTKRVYTVLFAALIFVSFIFTGCGKKEISLEYNLPKGEESKYKIKSDSTVTTTSPDNKKISIKTSTQAEISQKVKSVEKDGNFVMEVTYNNMKVTLEREGKTQDLPTGGIDGKSVSMKMSKRGKLLEFEGGELGAGADNVKQLGQMNAVFPEKSLKIGESWENHDSMSNPIPIPGADIKMVQNIDSKYTLTSVEKVNDIECAKINIESKITLKTEKGKDADKNPVKIDGNGEGNVKGTLYFAINKGRVVKADMSVSMVNSMTIQEKDKKQSTSHKIESSMAMELIK